MTDLEYVQAWQRGEIGGHEARRRIGARSYGDLYRVLRAHRVEPVFRPGDIARQAAAGEITREDVVRTLGLEDDVEAFISAWTAGGSISAG